MPLGVTGNTSDFDSEESRFEPWRGIQFAYIYTTTGSSSSGRARALGARSYRFESCLPDQFNALIAQLVEQLICNHQVRRSSRRGGTIYFNYCALFSVQILQNGVD